MKLPLHGPRAVRIRPEFLLNVIIAEVLLGAILLVASLVLVDPEHSVREIKTQGWPVQGKATVKRWKDAPRPDQTGFELPYRYTVKGTEYTGKSSVTLETFYSTPTDGAVTVWYLPEHPEISTLSVAVEPSEKRPARFLLFGLAGAIGAFTLAYRAVALRERRMLRDWTALPVTVARIEERQVGNYREYTTVLIEREAAEPREWTFATTTGHLDEEGKDTILLQNPANPRQVRRVERLLFAESKPDDAPYN